MKLLLSLLMSVAVMGQDYPRKDSIYQQMHPVRENYVTEFENDLLKLIKAQDEAIKLRDSIIQNYKDENRMYKIFIELLLGKKKSWVKKWDGDTSEDAIDVQGYRRKTK